MTARVRTPGCVTGPEWMPPAMPDPARYGIRLSLADVKGISDDEVARIVAGQPYRSLTDFWQRASVSRPVVERLVLAGGFDSLYGFGVRDREAGRATRSPHAGHPARPAAADRRTGPVEPQRGPCRGRRAAQPRPAGARARGGGGDGAGGAGRRRGRRAAGCPSSPTPNWSAPSWRCSAWMPAGTSSASTSRSSPRSARCRPASCSAAAAAQRCSSPGSRWPPRPRRSGPDGGWCS